MSFIQKALVKSQLRSKYLSERGKFILAQGPLFYSKLKHNLASIVTRHHTDKQTVIGSYIHIPNKQIIPPHLEDYQHAFPYFQAKSTKHQTPKMQFKQHSCLDVYTQRVYGIKVPNKTKPTVVPSVVLVPLACFHPISKQRIGYGGGYYDQYIKQCRSRQLRVTFIGVAYECLKENSIFWQSKDQSLDYVITQLNIY